MLLMLAHNVDVPAHTVNARFNVRVDTSHHDGRPR